MPAASRPAVTAEHQRDAFEAFAWTGWTFEQAMADPLRSRLVKLRARQLCTEQARVTRRTVVPLIDTRPFQVYQTGQRAWVVQQQTDLKRAAAGDRDD